MAVGVQHLAIPAVAAGQTVRSVPENYPTIQAAIDAADDGDRVLVAAGVYSEALIITKHVEVVGASRDSTVIQTSRFGTTGGSCMLANIQLKATGVLSEAVCVCCKIDGVLVVDCDTITLVGCDLSAASDAALVVGKGFGISGPSGSLENLVLRCCRFHHSIAGVRVNTQTTVRLEDCTIEDNADSDREDSGFSYGTNGGVYMSRGTKATLSGCTISRNTCGVAAADQHTEVTLLENNDISGNFNGSLHATYGGRITVAINSGI